MSIIDYFVDGFILGCLALGFFTFGAIAMWLLTKWLDL